MKRNKLIIISITGIILVVFILLGLTYAYFVTAIEGNENNKSIEVTTANLRLTYADGNGSVTMSNIMPGTTTNAKKFTVTNNGNNVVSNYKVYLEDVINTFTNASDVVINMTCTSSVNNKTCFGITDTTFPTTNEVLISNSINVGETQTYSLTVTYKETGVDQSADMNKIISGKIQIYDAKSIIDISGTVSDASNGDYVELQSNPKVSQINNIKEYKIVGVTPGEHTLYIKSSNGSIKGSKTIVINKSNSVSHEGQIINITEEVNNVEIDITSINPNLEIKINNIILNPYSNNPNLLSYHIINNAQINRNRTTYEPVPATEPGKEVTTVYSYKKNNSYIVPALITKGVNEIQQEYYWTYADSFIVDENTGKFSLVNPKTCKYSECYTNIVGKYVLSSIMDSNGSNDNILKTYINLSNIYKIKSNSLTSISLEQLFPETDSAERTISQTEDDYGYSYYFRGDIKDNYVNFNKMCFRIIRIEGDGSIKLVLEDKNSSCESNTNDALMSFITEAKYGYNENQSDFDYFTSDTNQMKNLLESFYKNNLINVQDKIKKDEWNVGNITDKFNYTTGLKLTDEEAVSNIQYYFYKGARLTGWTTNINIYSTLKKETGDVTYSSYIGALTADEVAFAGGRNGETNLYYYLYNKGQNYTWWTLTPSLKAPSQLGVFVVRDNGKLGYLNAYAKYYIRPAITLKSNTKIITGDGTKNNPYEIE